MLQTPKFQRSSYDRVHRQRNEVSTNRTRFSTRGETRGGKLSIADGRSVADRGGRVSCEKPLDVGGSVHARPNEGGRQLRGGVHDRSAARGRLRRRSDSIAAPR